MENISRLERREGVDIGYHESNLESLNRVGCVGKSGIDKKYTLEQVMKLAYEIRANIIIKAGKNAKWYLKKCLPNEIDDKIEKQKKWRDMCRYTMWVIEWEN